MSSGSDSRRNFLVVVLLTIAGALLRTYSTYNGGIWADEGLVFNIVAIPSWRDMFGFLSMHESHPPLFYVLVRAWQSLFGSSDDSTLSIAVVLGTAIIPSTYLVARSLFSRRAALIAAVLVAFSPSLIEHSAQLRPYGLLPLLVLLSSWALTKAIDGAGVRHWLAYAVTTTLMLYTHHWTWLVWGGQIVAFAFVVFHSPSAQRIVAIRRFAFAAATILVLYSAWLPSFLFQVVHAGHPAPALTDAATYALFLVLGAASIPSMLFLGNQAFAGRALITVGITIGAAVATEIVRVSRSNRFAAESPPEVEVRRNTKYAVFLITPAVSIIASLMLSLHSYMMLDRCLVMLTPLLLIPAAQWLSRTSERGRTGLLVFVASLSFAGTIGIVTQRRSNTREVAAIVQSRGGSSDLLIISPQWRAPAFNHYFPPTVEQIDFPQQGRSHLIDYSGLRERRSDSAALRSVVDRLVEARANNRRVWLITAQRYLTISPTSEISRALAETYGNPDTTLFERGVSARYEQLLPFLFAISK